MYSTCHGDRRAQVHAPAAPALRGAEVLFVQRDARAERYVLHLDAVVNGLRCDRSTGIGCRRRVKCKVLRSSRTVSTY